MVHMKFVIHECSGLTEQVILMDLNARIDVNYGRKGGRTGGLADGKPDAYIALC